MKQTTVIAVLLAMGMAMPAMADDHAAVQGEAKVEAKSEGGFFSRISNLFGGGAEAEAEDKGNSEAAQENAAESKADAKEKAEMSKKEMKQQAKAEKEKAKAQAKADKAQAKADKAQAKADAAKAKADGAAEEQAKTESKAEEKTADADEKKDGKLLGVDAEVGIKLGN